SDPASVLGPQAEGLWRRWSIAMAEVDVLMKPMGRTMSRLAVPWGAAAVMALVIAAMAARGPATSRAAQPAREPATAPSASALVPQPRTIVRVVGREFTVTISAGAHGNVFSAHRADGRVLASNVTLDELRTTQPDAYRQIQPALATSDLAHDAP